VLTSYTPLLDWYVTSDDAKSSYEERDVLMELFAMLIVALSLLGAFAATFGVDSRPGVDEPPRNI
jgi:hypothetical protein